MLQNRRIECLLKTATANDLEAILFSKLTSAYFVMCRTLDWPLRFSVITKALVILDDPSAAWQWCLRAGVSSCRLEPPGEAFDCWNLWHNKKDLVDTTRVSKTWGWNWWNIRFLEPAVRPAVIFYQGIPEHLHFIFDSGPGFCKEVGSWELFISNLGQGFQEVFSFELGAVVKHLF